MPYATDAPVVCCGEKRSCGDRSDHAAFCEEHRQTLLGLQAAPPAEASFEVLHDRVRARLPGQPPPGTKRSNAGTLHLCDDLRSGCPPKRLPSIYIHDPGERYNARARTRARVEQYHNWCVAYWLHQGLLRYRRRVHDVEEADAVFIALYGQYHNPKSDYLHFGRATTGRRC